MIRAVMSWARSVLPDIRHSARALRRSPSFVVATASTLALGMGTIVPVVALADRLLLRPLPGVAAPDELVIIRFERAAGRGTGISHANLEDLRGAVPGLIAMAAWDGGTSVQAQIEGSAPLVLRATLTEGDYFGTLGVLPSLGRAFRASETAPESAQSVAIISSRLWDSKFAARPDILGQPIVLNREAFSIIAVAPPGFRGTDRTAEVDIWLPMAAYGRLQRRPIDLSQRNASANLFFESIGRLRSDSTPALVQSQLRDAMSRLVTLYPDANEIYRSNVPVVYAGIGLSVLVRESTATTIRLLLAVVAALLIVCVFNVATLFLIRISNRFGETAVSIALGASTARVGQLHLIDALIIVGLGAIGAMAIAIFLRTLFIGQALVGLPGIEGLPFDSRVVKLTSIVVLVVTLLIAVVSTLGAVTRPVWSGLQSGMSRTATVRTTAMRHIGVVLQIAGAVGFICSTILLLRTSHSLSSVSLGIEAADVHLFGYNASPQGYDSSRRRIFDRQVLDDVKRSPGIEAVSLSANLPVGVSSGYVLSTTDGSRSLQAYGLEVTADFFETLGIAFTAGQPFPREREFEGLLPGTGVVITVTAAQSLFGTDNPIGNLIRVKGAALTEQPVIGVVKAIRLRGPRSAPTAAIFLPIGASAQAVRFLEVRSRLPHLATERLVTEAIASRDPSIPLFRNEPLTDTIARPLSEDRVLMKLLGICGIAALVISAVGVYGVLSYSLARRQRDTAIRIAIGGSPRQVIAPHLWSVTSLLVGGVGGGLVLARGLAITIASRLFGTTAADPWSYAGGAIVVCIVVLATSSVPLVQSRRMDVAKFLRAE